MTTEMGGVHFAIVESNKLDEEGCIQISLQGMDGKARPYPARIAAFMAGDQRGALFLPEKGDQVLVAFVNNSINDPVVIGCLWSRVHKPPEANADGANNVKLIKTRSGHEIRLMDKDGDEKIEIIDKTGKNRILIDSKNNNIAIDAPEGWISLNAKTINITSKDALKIVSTDSTVNVEAKGNTTIKGEVIDLNP